MTGTFQKSQSLPSDLRNVGSITTIQKDFTRIRNHIAKLPSQRLEDARKIRKYLLDSFPLQTVKKILMQINACCNWALAEELITANPFADLPAVKGGKPKKAINPFSEIEELDIIATFSAHPFWNCYAPFVKFLFLTGCRTSEAVGLLWKHIDEKMTTITFSEAVVERQRKDTKTHSIRKFPINQKLRSLLKEIKPKSHRPNSPVFLSPTGVTIDAHNFLNRAWKGILAEAEIDYRPQYNTRHTFITNCLEKKIPVTQVAKWVGNSPKTIWTHYAGLVNEMEVPE
jgi:integrase